jgi:outer membrane protein assembly factor BamA
MQKKSRDSFFILFLLAGILMLGASCSTTRRVEDGSHLLVKNKINIINPAKEISASDLESLVQQKPNKRFLGMFPLKLWINGVFKNSGEQPVLLDLDMIDESKLQMNRYLNNMGFYNSEIDHEVVLHKKKAKRVVYEVLLSEPYRIDSIRYSIKDDSLKKMIIEGADDALIQRGKIFNAFLLDSERNRITEFLRENGYYAFSKDYIFYEADTTNKSNRVDLTLNLKNVRVAGSQIAGESVFENHKVFYINRVFIHPDYRLLPPGSVKPDTLVQPFYRSDSKRTDLYEFVYTPPLRIRTGVIGRSMFIGTERKYNSTDAFQSFRKLNDFRIFKFTDINYKESEFKSMEYPERNYLDCTVHLTRNPLNSYSIELQGTNSGGDLGVAGYLVYQNRNLFRGAEVLSIKLKGALEAQSNTSVPEEEEAKLLFFNTFEAGIDVSLQIPRFLAPVNQDIFPRYFRPRTTISLGYNIQDRIDYERVVITSSFGYEWSETKFKTHFLAPLSANIIKINKTPEFDSLISQESQRFQNQYTDHLVIGMRYSYIFNNQELTKIKNFLYFRINLESAGNLLDLFVKLGGQEKNEEGFNTLLGIRYSQFVKMDFDFRYYIAIDRKNSVALRTFTGLAVPYGNSVDIPFETGFFGGGANGMRAWPLRYLGPGGYSESGSRSIERVGDIVLEANIEYRFPLISFFKGALFYDIGNIWLLRENETFPKGRFQGNNFYKELAMDAGVGLRLDFKFFILRIDLAQKVRDPARPESERWVIGSGKGWLNPVLNLGIGYPF